MPHQSDVNQVHLLLIQEVKRRLFQESIPRAKKCLALLSEERDLEASK